MANSSDQQWLWDSSWSKLRFAGENAESDITAMECWSYQDEAQSSPPSVTHEKQTFPISSLETWLKKPYPSKSNHHLLSGFKVLILPHDPDNPMPQVTESALDSIHAALNLPPSHRHTVSSITGADGFFLQPDGTYAIVHCMIPSSISPSVTLCYDPAANVTRGIFEIAEIPYNRFGKLQSEYSSCSHPLLLPLIALEVLVELTISENVLPVDVALREIERETGYELNSATENASLHFTGNLRDLTRRLGAAQSKMYFAIGNLRAARRSTEFLQQKLRYLSRTLPDEARTRLDQPSRMLEERIEYLLSIIENGLDFLALKERMETQQSVIFNLIAQMDGMVNIGLAKDSKEIAAASKRDSSAMKIVAVLTTAFLPGTFMATFFAMPLFNWSETSINNVANKHFWIYWAVTGPLTVAVVAGVASWAFLQSRRAERVAQLARRSTGIGFASDDEMEGTGAALTKRRGRGWFGIR